jgi:hypothetical protein
MLSSGSRSAKTSIEMFGTNVRYGFRSTTTRSMALPACWWR